jgi:hypothetical protein
MLILLKLFVLQSSLASIAATCNWLGNSQPLQKFSFGNLGKQRSFPNLNIHAEVVSFRMDDCFSIRYVRGDATMLLAT